MHSAVLFFSALLAISAATAVAYEEEDPQFDITENEFELDDNEMPSTEMTTAIAEFKDYIRALPEEPSGSQDVSHIEAVSKGEIRVPYFQVGMAIEVRYITPDNGRPTMDIIDKNNNILLHVNPRWDHRTFVLNTFHKKRWGPEERPSGFDFSSGVPITVRVEAKSTHFVILVNGRIIHHYKHRLPVNHIRRISFHWGGKVKVAKLFCLAVYFR